MAPLLAAPLRRATLSALPGAVSVPTYDARTLRPGVVHVGVGRFHRAHQATYFDRLAESGCRDWGVVGAGVRGRGTRDVLAAQDHLHTVVEASAGGLSARVVGAMQDYLCAPRDRAALLRLLAGDDVQLVTLTVTAEVYAAAGLDSPHGETTVFGLLVEALDARRRAGRRPFTVLSCDNVAANGPATAQALAAAADRRDPRGVLSAWVARNVACPASVVDRITPPADGLGADLAARFGLVDPCAVLTESYAAWVVEDTFSGERPPLEDVGVRFTSDVGPWAQAKTRLLNGGHCALGYLGTAAGHRTSAEAMADPPLAAWVRDLLHGEVVPTLDPPPGLDLRDYADAVLRRMADPVLADPLTRLSRRGSVRLPTYVVPSLHLALRTGTPSRRLTVLVAAWVHHLRTVGTGAEDALAAELVPLARLADVDARPLLRRTPGAAVLAADPRFVVALQRAVQCLETRGVRAALQVSGRPSSVLTVADRPTDRPGLVRSPAAVTAGGRVRRSRAVVAGPAPAGGAPVGVAAS